jgi:hypothetical protein
VDFAELRASSSPGPAGVRPDLAKAVRAAVTGTSKGDATDKKNITIVELQRLRDRRQPITMVMLPFVLYLIWNAQEISL